MPSMYGKFKTLKNSLNKRIILHGRTPIEDQCHHCLTVNIHYGVTPWQCLFQVDVTPLTRRHRIRVRINRNPSSK